ncbi:MAG: methionine--tRNA ligase [Kofleriaceae bacterium]|nr:methionine--tRNA ligase [Kofleriaceae bacterium]
MTRPFYVTTPIYYVNDVPHLGHAYTTIVADALARFHHMCGDDARFLTGTDEHGQKIVEAADRRGLTPQALCDEVAPRFRQTWLDLGMRFDDAVAHHGFARDFIRTTEPRHKAVVQALWSRILDRNPDDLFLASYEGWYCVGCETYYPESQLAKDPAGAWICPTHERPVAWVTKETSYFFRLSAYGERLLEHIERHPHFIQPEQYRNEVVSFLRGGLKDLSVSRTSFRWGIPVPEDPRHPGEAARHVMYVWFDALTNYLSALGDPFESPAPAVERYWSSAVHVIGKDILRFHAVYWPAFLLAAGLPLPRTILCHGWWSIGGRKISKSIPATRVSPLALAADLAGSSSVPATGIDAVRYFLLRETPLGNDGDLIYEGLIERYNADLANDLGNLINRSLTMIVRFGGGAAGARDAALAATGPHASLARVAVEAARDARMALDGFAPSRALEAVWRLVREANAYIAATEPWTLAKDPARKGELDHVLHTLAAALWWTRLLVAPVLPATAAALDGWLGAGVAERDARWPSEDGFGLDLPALRPTAATPLIPRIDVKRAAALLAGWLPPVLVGAGGPPVPAGAARPAAAPVAEAAAAAAPLLPTITYDDFAKLDLRVGVVVSARAVPKAKKLLELAVDLGEERPRTIVAGIAEHFAPDALVGRRVLVVANLAPRPLRGLTSEGMVLAAGDDAILALATVDAAAPPGTRVK